MVKKSIGKFLRFYVALKFRNANLTVRGENGTYNIDFSPHVFIKTWKWRLTESITPKLTSLGVPKGVARRLYFFCCWKIETQLIGKLSYYIVLFSISSEGSFIDPCHRGDIFIWIARQIQIKCVLKSFIIFCK